MIKKEILDSLNEQINKEFFSSYLYLSMSMYFESKGLSGFSSYMKNQALEEQTHAVKLLNYVTERGGRVLLDKLETPQHEWETPLAAFEAALKHEEFITESINKVLDISIDNRDHATSSFLQWFVNEQVEEEATASDIVNKLKLIGTSGNGIFMLDRELGQRVFVYPPAALSE
ncbi:ferritin [bacterium]|nr:ferritin [bacterium]